MDFKGSAFDGVKGQSPLPLTYLPLLPIWLLVVLAVLCLLATAAGAIRHARGWMLRGLAFLLLLVWLSGPSLVRARSEGLGDIGLLVVDHSASMRIGDRAALAERARAGLLAAAARLPGLELRTLDVPEAGHDGTRLFAAVQAAQASIPADRFAGVIAVTDGIVSDPPVAAPPGSSAVPLQVLIPARGEQVDRRLRLIEAPGFGIVHQSANIRAVVEDLGPVPAGDADRVVEVTVERDGAAVETRRVHPGEAFGLDVPIAHAGPTVVSLRAAALAGEVSTLNNQAVVSLQGVRDRLRVLLVSGEPNQGERSWRRLLRADPAIDLVHFTILRRPDQVDPTPISELALIPFPMQELFEDKIGLFDLIVLDRFADQDVLPRAYLARIADYVRGGGGLLLTAGPEFAGPESLDHTPLADVLPAHAAGSTSEGEFRPALTPLGLLHPVTQDLPGGPADAAAMPGWGPWFRSIDVLPPDAPGSGGGSAPQLLMQTGKGAGGGESGRPLLLLDRVAQGRVAMLLSDQAWLWSRRLDGGGPEAELARRVAHWLMAEPQLEEEQLHATIGGGELRVERRSVLQGGALPAVTVTSPEGATSRVVLQSAGSGVASGRAAVGGGEQAGAWRVSDGTRVAFAVQGMEDPAEYADLRASASVLGGAAAASGGGVHWLGRDGVPALRRVEVGAAASGDGWVGLARRHARRRTGAAAVALLPPWLALSLIGGAMVLAWRREMA